MAQNIYDNLVFFAGYSRLRRSIEGLGRAGVARPARPVARHARHGLAGGGGGQTPLHHRDQLAEELERPMFLLVERR
jgi:hypothetical protein